MYPAISKTIPKSLWVEKKFQERNSSSRHSKEFFQTQAHTKDG